MTEIVIILAVLRGGVSQDLLNRLLDAGFHVTELSSMGGFFRRKNTTLITGAPIGKLEEALNIVREACANEPESDEHRATLFVLDTEQFLSL